MEFSAVSPRCSSASASVWSAGGCGSAVVLVTGALELAESCRLSPASASVSSVWRCGSGAVLVSAASESAALLGSSAVALLSPSARRRPAASAAPAAISTIAATAPSTWFLLKRRTSVDWCEVVHRHRSVPHRGRNLLMTATLAARRNGPVGLLELRLRARGTAWTRQTVGAQMALLQSGPSSHRRRIGHGCLVGDGGFQEPGGYCWVGELEAASAGGADEA